MAFNDPHNAFVDLTDEAAAPAPGRPRLAVKDMIAVKGCLQTAGLAARADVRAAADAAAVARFRRAGYAVLGTTRSDGAGFGTMTAAVANPAFPGRAVGGSSGGAAAAVAGGLADIGLGTDTGGSVRIPAAYCGLLAFKPTPERVDMAGVLPLSETFDVLGVMARDMGALSAAAPLLVDRWAPCEAAVPPVLRYPAEDLADMDPAVSEPFAALVARWGAGPMDNPVPYRSVAMAHSDIVCAEGLRVHEAAFARAPHLFPPVTASALAYAETVPPGRIASAYQTAATVRAAWRQALGPGEVLVLPALPMPPADRWAERVTVAGEDMPVTNANIRLTLTFNVAGLPVVVTPVDGLSMQFVAAAGADEWLLEAVAGLLAR